MTKRMTWALILGLTMWVPNTFGQATEEATKEATKQEETQEEKKEESPNIATDEKTTAFHGKLKGDWSVVSMKQGADEMPAGMVAQASFSFGDDGGLTMGGLGPGDTECDFKLDASGELTTISLKPKTEAGWATGIVKIDDDGQVTMCLSIPGAGDPPTEFKCDDSTPTRMMAVLKKKEAEDSDEK